jgi:hypothetical protein
MDDTKKMLTKNVDADVAKEHNKQICYKEVCRYKIPRPSALSSFLLRATSPSCSPTPSVKMATNQHGTKTKAEHSCKRYILLPCIFDIDSQGCVGNGLSSYSIFTINLVSRALFLSAIQYISLPQQTHGRLYWFHCDDCRG